jgi:1,4-dihydroxy-2-naphthoyl-CoA hydrolase
MSLIDRINANPLPFAQLLGIEFISAEADALAARMLIRPDLCTIGGIAHGGAIMSFADTLGAAAAFINLPPDAKGTTTIESKTNFVASAPAGSTVIGHTSVIHRGQKNPDLADPGRDRRREAGHARRADADEPLNGLRANRASKRKLRKENESNFAFICFHLFFRIGAFQRVTADSNKIRGWPR